MANALDALIDRIPDEALRRQIREALKKQNQQKKFGLVFEDHIPESTVLYDVPVKAGSTVALRGGDVSKQMKVLAIDGEVAHCLSLPEREPVDQPLESLVSVAKFGEPIYPYLKQLDTVCNAPGSDLWHTLIEADNYHALQLLEYLYAEKIDCIYIDPPYNNRAKTWKYNNDYVDPSDDYRHSKWLSMIEKRLKIAKRLLNPTNSVLIVTIDEREYIHLGCLLEEMFPSARMQMISSVINPAGAGRQTEFSRTDEYIYILQFGEQTILPESREVENVPIIWDTLRRSSLANARGRHGKGACGPNQFYPIYVDDATGRIREIGEPIMEEVDRFSVPEIPGCSTVFPVRPDGTEMNWGIKPEEARIRLQKGYLRAGKHTPNAPQQYVISYVTGGNISDIEAGIAIFDGYEDDGSVKAYYPKGRDKMPTTNWNRIPHDAQRFGTNILTSIIGSRFDYPKSLYAVYDCLRYFVYNKPNALVVDFFAGSGTTLHSVNLINSEDNGNRRCIMITNNEVSSLEAAQLEQEGLHPGDDRWEQYGVAKYVTWPRTKCSILGIDINGKVIELPVGIEKNWKHQLSDLPKVGESGMVEYPQVNTFIDTALMLATDAGDLAIINYAIKKLKKSKLSDNGKKLAAKRFMHMAALHPYLLQLMEEYVFSPYGVDINDIKAFSDTIYQNATKKNDYESLCYAIYFAIRFDFVLNGFEIDYIAAQDYVIKSKDCLLLTMTWIYFMKQNHWKRGATQVKPLNRVAMELKNSDIDRYWLFWYEALSWGSLPSQWRLMKQAGISFIRKEIVDVTTANSTKSN